MSNILIIDDDPALCRTLEIQLKAAGQTVHFVLNAADGVAGAVDQPDIIFLDLNLPDRTGLEILPDLIAASSDSSIIMMTGNTDNRAAVEAMRLGAFDYLRKPLDLDELLAMVEKVQTQKSTDGQGSEEERVEPVSADDMIGAHPKIIEVHKQIGLLARTRVTTLIHGESGTGKELAARILHNASSPDQPFVAINCSAVVPTLLESELFGHEKGAFTGAEKAKQGKLEFAAQGTVFLDEIGDMALDLQGKLLRVLQEEEFTRVGGLKAIPLRARIVTATHRDLANLVAQGVFRQDLFYRLNVTVLNLPPLRERLDDIPLLSEALLAKISRSLGQPYRQLSAQAVQRLMDYTSPGNARELENVLTRAAALSRGSEIQGDDLELTPQEDGTGEEDDVVTLADAERKHIRKVLIKYNWNITHTATQLEISPTTLRKKIQDYNLQSEK